MSHSHSHNLFRFDTHTQITEPLEPVLIITKPDESKKTAPSSRQALSCLSEEELISVMPEVCELRWVRRDRGTRTNRHKHIMIIVGPGMIVWDTEVGEKSG